MLFRKTWSFYNNNFPIAILVRYGNEITFLIQLYETSIWYNAFQLYSHILDIILSNSGYMQ